MKIALWIVQALLALAFIGAGLMKLVTPYEEMAAQMAWVGRYSEGMIMFIGVAETLGGIGVILPSILKIQPKLAPLAALGLMTIMLLAAADHLRSGEMGDSITTIVLGLLAAFVAWGRWKKVPIG